MVATPLPPIRRRVSVAPRARQIRFELAAPTSWRRRELAAREFPVESRWYQGRRSWVAQRWAAAALLRDWPRELAVGHSRRSTAKDHPGKRSSRRGGLND